jgi:hypothetical protein
MVPTAKEEEMSRTFVIPPVADSNPAESWWACAASDFYARCRQEQLRMQSSRFGRLVEMAKFGGNEVRKDVRHKAEFWAE